MSHWIRHRFPSIKRIFVATISLCFLMFATVSRSDAGILGGNLLANPDAELGAGSPTGNVVSVPGWSVVGDFTVVKYGVPGGFPLLTDAGPLVRGTNFFAGGPSNAASSASQLIDVSSEASAIDAGDVTFSLAAYLGGFSSQRDHAVLEIDFLNAADSSIGFDSIGPVSNTERSNLTGLLPRSSFGAIPVGTRTIDVTLWMTRVDGAYNDGYADNLSLILTASPSSVPEPSTFALAASCIGFLFVCGRRSTSSSNRISHRIASAPGN
ncbi:MAG: hypothetical protein NT069_21870 [Planctomycetota bacterium]|nr:hypothetical protein [Planctomycetota bacterium]